MGLLDSLHQLLGNEVSGAKNIYHGLNPFDRQGWRAPLQTPINHALPATPNQAPSALSQLLQGSASNLNVGSSDLRLPTNPIQPYNYMSNGVGLHVIPSNQSYDLLNGGWRADANISARYLNPQYFQNKFPIQSQLPRIQ